MQNWERSEFDEQWKEAFARGEVAPSPMVWASLERELTLAESEDGKRRIIFYQRLAAACVLFALTAGLFGVYHWRNSETQMAEVTLVKNNGVKNGDKTIANKAEGSTQSKEGEVKFATKDSNSPERKLLASGKRKNSSDKMMQPSTTPRQVTAGEDQSLTALDGHEQANKDRTWLAANIDLPSPELLPEAKIHGQPQYVEIVHKLPYIPSAFMAENKKDNFSQEKLWASVTAASGAYSESSVGSYSSVAAARMFSTNSQSGAAFSPNTSSTAPAGISTSVGKSYSYGVIGGVRVAERWVVQTGVQYLNQSLTSSSIYANAVVSTNEFVSVPVQAGYLLINKKIGLQLNPGVATDLFVRTTVSNQQQSFTQGSGIDSPYRPVNFAGLMSSEFSYKLGKNYRLSVVPGMKYLFNPILKSQTTGNSLLWDVGFRFRYIFK